MQTKILLAEDDPLNINMMTLLLSENGYEVITAKDGLQALHVAKTKEPDIILMDIQMPGMSGAEVTRKLKSDRKFCHIPIFAITSFGLEEDKRKIKASGVDEFFLKPVSIKQLLTTIKKYTKNK